MEKKWTAAQTAAITAKNRTLLVSAAAGSGKTATLTERIIRAVTDESNPADISRMLIVTFTKAAAAELKERISAALSEALAKNPSNKNILRQFMLLPSAKISTIHSFCLDIIRANYQALGLSPSFRVSDEAEATLMSKETMDELVNYCYDSTKSKIAGGAASFPYFVDQLIGAKDDDRLSDILLDIYKKLSSYPDSAAMLLDHAKQLEEEATLDFFETSHGKATKRLIQKELDHFKASYEHACTLLAAHEHAKSSYLPSFEHDLAYIKHIKSAMAEGYEKIAELFSDYEPKRPGGLKTEFKTDETEWAKEMRDSFKKFVKEHREISFSLSGSEISEVALKTAHFCRMLHSLLSEYESLLKEKKVLYGVCDFSDLEHYALKLLYENGSPTPLALSTAQNYDEIYIDEYQDINSVQDMIFRSISRKHNRFMVGDIKQSIYAFRGANPDIFAHMRAEYPPLDKAGDDDDSAAIFMSSNFRCDRPVVDFVNTVFDCLFPLGSTQLGYRSDDSLLFAKTAEAAVNDVNVVIIDGEKNDDGEVNISEPDYVAVEISRLIAHEKKNDGTPVRPGDITILLRSVNNVSALYEQALKKRGIPYYSEVPTDFFENAEVLLIMSLLNCIDNPRRDIYLAGVMCSPLYGFSLDELIEIRKAAAPDITLYDALLSYCGQYDYLKGRLFLDALDKYRVLSQGMPVDKLLWKLYRETSALSLVRGTKKDTRDIRVRRANLMLLYDYARKFESGSFKGLYNFIRYVNGIVDEGKKIASAKSSGESDDTVKIMSIHKSKGLEFPVCFLCDTMRKHSSNDKRSNLLFDVELGAAVRLRDETGLARCDTPHRRAVSGKISERQTEEELRVLYVALTRARERLYVTASGKSEKLLKDACGRALALTGFAVCDTNNYMEWILTALNKNPCPSCRISVVKEPTAADLPDNAPNADNCIFDTADADNTTDEEQIYNTLVKRFSFEYPYSHISRIPAKLSVSKLYPGVLDESDTDEPALDVATPPTLPELPDKNAVPAFMGNVKTGTGADSGTATHLFMQFCDLNKLTPEGTKAELERLIVRGYIPKEAAELVNIGHIQTFAKSGLLARMRSCERIFRELRFNIKLPAPMFTGDPELASKLAGEELLVQGVIDCIFEEGGEIVLVDYKTDTLTEYELSHPEAAGKKLISKHSQQLCYYAAACERILGRKPGHIYIYSLPLGREIEIMTYSKLT